MRHLALAMTALAALSLTATPSLAAPCKDAKGKFTKCPPPAMSNVMKGKDGRCRVASGKNKGKFTKC